MAKARDKPIWGRLVRCVDKATGEEFMGWRAYAGDDALAMRELGLAEGQESSAEFSLKRNLKNFRQAHKLAEFVRDNADVFPINMDSHSVLKAIQRDANIECDDRITEIDLGTLGKHKIIIREPKSLNFSTMKQEVWRKVFARFRDYCMETFFPDFDQAQVAEFEKILKGNLPP